MLIISKYLLGTRSIECISTREKHKILSVRVENDYSDPEIYILEESETPEVVKNLLIIEENIQLNYKFSDLNYINFFEFRKGLHKFFVFEIINNENISINHISTRKDFVKVESNLDNFENDIDVYKKYARVPKPDLDKHYTKDELLKMHPTKQLKHLLLNKYNLKNKVCKKLSIENQIDFILNSQDGKKIDPISLINPTEIQLFDIEDIQSDVKVISYSNNDPQFK